MVSKSLQKVKEFSKVLRRENKDEVTEDGIRKYTDWPSILILALVGFLQTIAGGASMTITWPYLKLLDNQVSDLYSGYMTSGHALGTVIASILAGFISNKVNNVKLALICGKLLYLIASCLYLSIEHFSSGHRYLFLICDFITSLAPSVMMVGRTHIAMASSKKHRQRSFAIITLSVTLGSSLGNLINSIFVTLGYPGKLIFFGNHLNVYTAPIYLSMLMNVIGLMILWFCFHSKLSPVEDKEVSKEQKHHIDKIAVIICFSFRIIITFILIVNNTLGSMYSMAVFQWTSNDAVFYNSLIQGIVGAIGLAVYIAYTVFNINNWISERKAILFAIMFYLAFYLSSYPWPFYGSSIKYQTSMNTTNGNVSSTAGCNPSYKWCADTPAVNVWVYNIAYLIFIGAGMPVVGINLDSLFSKVLGPIRQGTMQGFFLAAGHSLNIFGSIVFRKILINRQSDINDFRKVYVMSGPRYIWLFIICIISLGVLAFVIFYRRMVDFSIKKSNDENDDNVKMKKISS
uniref:Uncharacterized protein n=3 Tax=Acrobeloides nanus TaxID=290746 RepID=A0A914EE50_9BILA